MDSKQFNKIYWKHYIVLEEDFMNTLRYVELQQDNFNTYSVEFNKLLQSICSEFDVVCKEICKLYDTTKNNIKEYAEVILRKFENLTNEVINLRGDNSFFLKPLENWIVNPEYKSPQWWHDYNSVKHDRANNFRKANMGNVLEALASLYLIEMYFAYEIASINNDILKIPEIPSLLFEINGWKANQVMMPGGILLDYIN